VKVGDLVKARRDAGVGSHPLGIPGCGIILRDRSPMRPPDVGRLLDVLWSDGEVCEWSTRELEVISEGR
jgi:hypothetical protein